MMRVAYIFIVLIPSALAVGWLVRSRLRARFDRQSAERRRIADEIELTEGEWYLLDDQDRLIETTERLIDKAKRTERRT
jgi:hypothetical protein